MRAFRPEIQALRAVAVLLILAFHASPYRVPGGFVGVDVFFCISGFLITGLLLRELDRTGRVSLPAFWARRARRILPAALFVLAACAVATVLVVPETFWRQFFVEIRASALFYENWHLAQAAVDYLAADDAPSPVQHYWTLSAEEQLYLAWPLLVFAAAVVASRRHRPGGRRAIAAVLAAACLLSLGFSVYASAKNPAAAYFSTFTRAWEFAAGGLLALIPASQASGAIRSAVSWTGLGMIAVAALVYSDETVYPGLAALLPVLGAVAVVWAGTPSGRGSPTPVLTLRPVQFVGGVSYSAYLWHWPLLVLMPFVVDRALARGERAALVVLAIGLAWITKVLVEDPVRRSPRLTRSRARWTLVAAAAGVGAILAIGSAGIEALEHRIRDAEQAAARVLEDPPRCFGAAARDPGRSPCLNPALEGRVIPTPAVAESILAEGREYVEQVARTGRQSVPPGCEREGGMVVCTFGASLPAPTRTIAILGDSHAAQWRPASGVLAATRHWRISSSAFPNCPYSAAAPAIGEPWLSECKDWRASVVPWLAAHPEVNTVLFAQRHDPPTVTPAGEDAFETRVRGYVAAWRSLPRSVKGIGVIRDNPGTLPEGQTFACVDRAMSDGEDAGRACALPRAEALPPDPAVVAATRIRSRRVRVIDLTRFFCGTRSCPPVIGGSLVYLDADHITPHYSVSLAPYLAREIDLLVSASK